MSLYSGRKIQNFTEEAIFYTIITLKDSLNDFGVKTQAIRILRKFFFYFVFAEDVHFITKALGMVENVFFSFFHFFKKTFAFVYYDLCSSDIA